MKKVKIKYYSEEYERLKKLPVGDWIDVRVDSIKDIEWDNGYFKKVNEDGQIENIGFKEFHKYKKGDVLFLHLGVAMELPKGYEAYLVPRSSTFKNTGFILTNGIGIIDESYCGDTDEWRAMVYCTRDGMIERFDRLFQFRIQKKMEDLEMLEVDSLDNESRGGYGSTGLK